MNALHQWLLAAALSILQIGDRVPDAQLTFLDGTERRVSEVAGAKATLFYFMATW